MENCEKHKKEFQVYCYDDYQFLCADCLFDQTKHKNHKLENMKDASKKIEILMQHHLVNLEKVEKNFEVCNQKSLEFHMNLELFNQKIVQKIHFSQLKILKQVNEAFEVLNEKIKKKFTDLRESLMKQGQTNQENLFNLQSLMEKMRQVLQNSSENTLVFKYHSSGIAKENFDLIAKKFSPIFEVSTQKNIFNESSFLTVELSKTIDRLKSEITYKTDRNLQKSPIYSSISKQFNSQNPSAVLIEDIDPITTDVLKGMASDIKATLTKKQVIFDNGEGYSTTHFPSNYMGHVSSKNLFPLTRNSSIKFDSISSNYNALIKKQGSCAKITTHDFKVDFKQKTQKISNLTSKDHAYIIGGTCSKDFTLKIFDFKNLMFEHKKTNFPAISKPGVVLFENELYIFGGKINGKASDKIFKYDLNQKLISEHKNLTLTRKKYNFGYTEIEKGVVIIFGGKDDLGLPIADIELIDLSRNFSRIVGKMGQPKFGVFALKLNQKFKVDCDKIEKSENISQGDGQQVLHECAFDKIEGEFDSQNLSFNVSALEGQHNISSNFKYSFEQNPCEVFSGQKGKNNIEVSLEDDADYSKVEFLTLESPGIKRKKTKFDLSIERILIIGGQSLSRTILNSVEVFNLITYTCHLFGELKESRKACWAVHTNYGVLIFGGKGPNGFLSSIETYQGKKFVIKSQMNVEKSGFKGMLKNNELLLIGGENKKGMLNCIESYSLNSSEIKFLKKIQTIPSFSNFDLIYSGEV